MYTRDVCIDDIIFELERNHRNIYKKSVRQAAIFAAAAYKESRDKNGGDSSTGYMRALRVARFISSWGFENNTICAALLYDVVANDYKYAELIKQDFGDDVVDIINKVNFFYLLLKNGELDLAEDDELTKDKKNIERALYIKAAERIDDLYTIDKFTNEEKQEIVSQTRRLLELLTKERAFSVINHLEDLCLKIEDESLYAAIENKVDQICKANSYTIDSTLKYFDSLFLENDINLPEECRSYQSYVALYKSNRRSIVSVYRQFADVVTDNIDEELLGMITKKNVALYDLTLVISERDYSTRISDLPNDMQPFDVFFKFYEYAMRKNGICIIGNKRTTYNDSHYFLLKDNMENMYRIFVKSESEYMRFRIGYVAENIMFNKEPASLKGKIKVFTASGEARYIDDGATMLDFAFMIHSELGYHFKHAMVGKTIRSKHDRLRAGDRVEIVIDSNIKPDMKWFKYVKTDYAIDSLIRQMSSKSKEEVADA